LASQHTKPASSCRDKRIFSTGCAGEFRSPRASVFGNHFLTIYTAENTKMNDCYFEKKDWRLCRNEVREASFFEDGGLAIVFDITCDGQQESNHKLTLLVLSAA